MELNIYSSGLGLSLIDTLNTELLFVSIEHLSLNIETDLDLNSVELILNSMQIDNMMPGTEYPVLLQPKYISSSHVRAGLTFEEDVLMNGEKIKDDENAMLPCFNLVLVQRKNSQKTTHQNQMSTTQKNNTNKMEKMETLTPSSSNAIQYYPYFMIALQEMNLCCEENLLYRLGTFISLNAKEHSKINKNIFYVVIFFIFLGFGGLMTFFSSKFCLFFLPLIFFVFFIFHSTNRCVRHGTFLAVHRRHTQHQSTPSWSHHYTRSIQFRREIGIHLESSHTRRSRRRDTARSQYR